MTAVLNITADFDPSRLDGEEIAPAVWLIGTPTWNDEAKEWRSLARVGNVLAVVAFSIKLMGRKPSE